MLEGRSAVLTGLHVAEPCVALWRRALVRCSRNRRRSGLCRSGRRNWIRIRDQPDGHVVDRRPARCRAQKRALLRSPRTTGNAVMTTMKAFITRRPHARLTASARILVPAATAGVPLLLFDL